MPDLEADVVDLAEPGALSQLILPFFWDEVDYDACAGPDTAD
jgi:hypothetical protein